MISVIVPVYNAEPCISACVESVLGQTETSLEILLTDGGSTDRSGRICDEMSRRDAGIHVIHTSHKGVSCARNLGMTKACQRSAAPHKYISRHREFISENLFLSKIEAELYPSEEFFRKMFSGDFLFAVRGTVYRKECLRNCRFEEVIVFEDAPVNMELLHK